MLIVERRLAVAIGAPRRADINHRARLAGMDILASAAVVRMVGAPPLIGVPGMAEDTVLAIADTLAARGMA
ncbi:MAG: hypothetical protein ACRELG_09855 [Gemmataceae bacterium]